MTAFDRRLASVAAVAMLASCTTQGSAKPEPMPSPAPSEQGDRTSCGADKLGSFLGAMPTAATMAKIKTVSGAQTIRVVGPNDVMTMDFRVDRLTISTAANGRIKQFRCV